MPEIKVGDMAPDFETLNDKNEKVKLSDFRGKRVVLYFYPADETRGCTVQACAFRDAYPEFEEQNAIVLGVSPQGVESHQGFRDHYELPFPLLVDEDKAICELYDVWRLRTRQDGTSSMGVSRSHFVIDEQGKVIDVQYGVTPENSPVFSLATLAG